MLFSRLAQVSIALFKWCSTIDSRLGSEVEVLHRKIDFDQRALSALEIAQTRT